MSADLIPNANKWPVTSLGRAMQQRVRGLWGSATCFRILINIQNRTACDWTTDTGLIHNARLANCMLLLYRRSVLKAWNSFCIQLRVC